MKYRLLSAALLAAFLTACAAPPTRVDSSKFVLKNEGRIAPTNVLTFSDCLIDGFESSHGLMTDITVKQTRRASGYRVEAYAASRILIMSADIFEDGRTELHESTSAGLIDTSGERNTYAGCLKKYGI